MFFFWGYISKRRVKQVLGLCVLNFLAYLEGLLKRTRPRGCRLQIISPGIYMEFPAGREKPSKEVEAS